MPKSEPAIHVDFEKNYNSAQVAHPEKEATINHYPKYRKQILARIQKIMKACSDETWAPISLRCHLVESIDSLEDSLFTIDYPITAIRQQIEHLAQEFSAYQTRYPESGLIRQIHILNREINSPDNPWMLLQKGKRWMHALEQVDYFKDLSLANA